MIFCAISHTNHSLLPEFQKTILRKGHGFKDKHQEIFFFYNAVVDKKRPKVLFLENVKNLKSHDKGNNGK